MTRLFVPYKTRFCRGFTLVEIVVVLVLLGVLTAVAVVQITGDNDAEIHAATDKLKVHLRHAQGRAMNSDTSWGINHLQGNGYWLFSAGDINNRKRLLGEDQPVVSLPDGVTAASFTVSFDEWGRPFSTANPDTGSPNDGAMVIVIDPATTITITPETGFIP